MISRPELNTALDNLCNECSNTPEERCPLKNNDWRCLFNQFNYPSALDNLDLNNIPCDIKKDDLLTLCNYCKNNVRYGRNFTLSCDCPLLIKSKNDTYCSARVNITPYEWENSDNYYYGNGN